MIKYFFFLFIIILFNNCSFDTKSGLWTQEKEIETVQKDTKKLFDKELLNENEFNKDLILKISNNVINKDVVRGNNLGILDFDLKFNKISRYKFKKIEYFDQFEPELIFFDNDLIFFDNKGTIIRFSDDSKIIWKKNYYNKSQKKLKPILSFSHQKNFLLVSDSLSRYYLVDLRTGKLIWSKDHVTNFISDIKIDNNKFYVLDSNNSFLCFSLIDGKKLWEFQTEQKLINSQKKTSIIFNNFSVFFNNTKGEVVSLDKNSGELIWLTSTLSFEESNQSFLYKTSDLVLDNSSIYLSNNKNKFISIDVRSGLINWTQMLDSQLRPIIVDDIILTVSTNGYLYVIQKKTGKIIRITNIFSNLKKGLRKKIKPTGFAVSFKDIFVTTNVGQLFVINTSDGKQNLLHKISRDKISKPYINNKKLYVIKDNQIIKLN